MDRFISCFVLLFASAVSPAAFAEPGGDTLCRACPAITHIRTCGAPVDGASLVRGRVVGFLKGKCSIIMSFEPQRAEQQGLPRHIGVDLGPCTVWSGRTNAPVRIAVYGPRSYSDPAFPLACQR
jgi:hypothetical protein